MCHVVQVLHVPTPILGFFLISWLTLEKGGMFGWASGSAWYTQGTQNTVTETRSPRFLPLTRSRRDPRAAEDQAHAMELSDGYVQYTNGNATAKKGNLARHSKHGVLHRHSGVY